MLTGDAPTSETADWASKGKFSLFDADGIARFDILHGPGPVFELVFTHEEIAAPQFVTVKAEGEAIEDSPSYYVARLTDVNDDVVERYFLLDDRTPPVDLIEAVANLDNDTAQISAVALDAGSGVGTTEILPPGIDPSPYDGEKFPAGPPSQPVSGQISPGITFVHARDQDGKTFGPASMFLSIGEFNMGNAGNFLQQLKIPVRGYYAPECPGELVFPGGSPFPSDAGRIEVKVRSSDMPPNPTSHLLVKGTYPPTPLTTVASIPLNSPDDVRTHELNLNLKLAAVAEVTVTALGNQTEFTGTCYPANQDPEYQIEFPQNSIQAQLDPTIYVGKSAALHGLDGAGLDYQPVAPGANVTIDIPPLQVEIDHLEGPGHVAAGPLDVPPPDGFHPSSKIYHVSVNAQYEGLLRIRMPHNGTFTYAPTLLAKSQMWRFHDGAWSKVDSVHEPNGIVGETPGTSLFMLAVKDGLAPSKSAALVGPQFVLPDNSRIISGETGMTLAGLDHEVGDDVDTGVRNLYYRIGAPFTTLNEAGVQTFTGPIHLTEGVRTVYYTAEDNVGNFSSPASETVLVDATPPMTALSVQGETISTTEEEIVVRVGAKIVLTPTDYPLEGGVRSGSAGTFLLVGKTPQECGFDPDVQPPADPSFAAGTCENPYYSGPLSLAVGTYDLLFASVDNVQNLEGLRSRKVRVGLANTLAASLETGASARLRWIAPDNDGAPAASYDVRWAAGTAITEETFANATPIPDVAAPKAPGEQESLLVAGLPSASRVYFALKSIDAAGNGSALSNSPYVDTQYIVYAGGGGSPQVSFYSAEATTSIELVTDASPIALTTLRNQAAAQHLAVVSDVFDLRPENVTFSPPAVLNFGYAPSALQPSVPESAIRLFHYNKTSFLWELVPGQVLDEANNVVTASFQSVTSIFALYSVNDPAPPGVPAGAGGAFSAVGQNTLTVSWDGGTNPPDTAYRVELSASPTFTTLAGFQEVAVTNAVFTGLSPNLRYYARAAAKLPSTGGWGTYTDLGAAYTHIQPPTSVVCEEVTTNSLVASAYAPTPAFSNLGAGVSGTIIAIDGDFGPEVNWHGEAWRPRAPLPFPRYGHAAASLGGRVYAVGGYVVSQSVFPNSEFDPVSNSWVERPGLAGRRPGLTVVSYDGTLFAMGGDGNNGPSSFHASYAPGDSAWVTAPVTRAPLVPGRTAHIAGAINGRILVAGGVTSADPANSAFYAPASNSWVTDTTRIALQGMGAAVVGGQLYSFGGYAGSFSADTLAYDPISHAWTTRAPMPTPRASLASASLGGKAYSFGGQNAAVNGLTVTEEFDPGANAWAARLAMPTGRSRPAAAAAGGRIYVLGGGGGDSANEEYDPGVARLFTELTPNTPYTFKAKARNGAGVETADSAEAIVYTLAAIPAAADPSIMGAGAYSASLQWSANGNPVGTRFRAQASLNAPFTGELVSTAWSDALTTVVAGLAPNTLYHFRVQAKNSDGDGVETAFLPLGSARTLAAVPAAGDPSITGTGAHTASLQWAANGNPAGTQYRAQASLNADFTGEPFSSAWSDALTAVIAGLTSDTQYHFRVQAKNGDGIETAFLSLGSAKTSADILGPRTSLVIGAPSVPAAGALPAIIGTATPLSFTSADDKLEVNDNQGVGGVQMYYRFDAAPFQPVPDPFTAGAAGPQQSITFYGLDAAGNKGGETTTPLAVDAAAPEVDFTGTPLYTNQAMPSLRALFTDALAGVDLTSLGLSGVPGMSASTVGNGLLKAWEPAPALGTPDLPAKPRYAFELVHLNGRIYAIGGHSGGPCCDEHRPEVYVSQLSGGVPGPWTQTASLPGKLAGHAAAAVGGRLYTVGGSIGGNPAMNTVYYGDVGASGAVTWQTDLSVPRPPSLGFLDAVGLSAGGNRLYAIGGRDAGGSMHNYVYSTPLDPATGAPTGWTAGLALPVNLGFADAVEWGGRIYVAGGLTTSDAASASNIVYSIAYNSAGALVPPWRAETALMKYKLYGLEIAAFQGRLYVMGGRNDQNVQQSAVFSFRIAPDGGTPDGGTLDDRRDEEPLHRPLDLFASVATNDALIYAGGSSPTGVSPDVRWTRRAVGDLASVLVTGSLTTGLQEGLYTLAAQGKDRVGNLVTGSQDVRVDFTAPGLTLSAGGAPLTAGSEPLVAAPVLAAVISDATSGVDPAAVRVFLNGADVTAQANVTSAGLGAQASLTPPLAAGSHTLEVRATDRAGNAAALTGRFSLDPTKPTVSLTAPAAGAVFGDASIAFAADFADAESGLNAATLKLAYGNADGTTFLTPTLSLNVAGLSAWNSAPALGTPDLPAKPRYAFELVHLNGRIYAIGGHSGGPCCDEHRPEVYVSQLSGGVPGPWTQTASLPGKLAGHAAAAVGGRLYTVGGSIGGNPAMNTVYYGDVGASGAVTWHTDLSVPRPPSLGFLDAVGLSAVGNRLYAIGGRDAGGSMHNYVYSTPLDPATGAPTGWTAGPVLPVSLGFADAVEWGGRIYVAGGLTTSDAASASNIVYSIAYNSAGDLVPPWRPETTLMKYKLYGLEIAAFQGRLYVMGGRNDQNVQQSAVFSFRIAPDGGTPDGGTLDDRRDEEPLHRPLDLFASVATNDALIYAGGSSPTGVSPDVRYKTFGSKVTSAHATASSGILPEGAYTARAEGTDMAGNPQSEEKSFAVDTSPPTTTLNVAPGCVVSPGLVVAPQDSVFSLTATDKPTQTPSAGVTDTFLTIAINGGAPATEIPPVTLAAAGSYALTFWSRDALGREEDPAAPANTVVVRIDPAPLKAVATDGTASLTADNSQSALSIALLPIPATVDGTPAGAYKLAAEQQGLSSVLGSFYELSGGEFLGVPATLAFYFDPTDPTTAANISQLRIYTFVNGDWVDGPIEQLGITPISEHRAMYAGRLMHTSLYGLFIRNDSLPPRTALALGAPSVPAAGAAPAFVTPATLLSLTAVDDKKAVGDGLGVGVASTAYAVGSGTAFAPYTAPFALPEEGAHVIRYFSTDRGGRVESVRSAALGVDGSGPAVGLAYGAPFRVLPATATVFFSGLGPLSLSATDYPALAAGTSALYLSVDGGAAGLYGGPFSLSEGLRSLAFWGVDALGNQGATGTLSVKLDVTPPAAVTDLVLTALSSTSLAASWTAAGDDGTAGDIYDAAVRLDFGVDSEPLTEALLLSSGPLAAGARFGRVFTDLVPGARYRAVAYTRDSAGYWSEPSNAASANTYTATGSEDGVATLTSPLPAAVSVVPTADAAAAYAAAGAQALKPTGAAFYEVTGALVLAGAPPAVLSFTFDPALADPAAVGIYLFDEQAGVWLADSVSSQTVVPLASGLVRISGELAHTGLYAPLVRDTAPPVTSFTLSSGGVSLEGRLFAAAPSSGVLSAVDRAPLGGVPSGGVTAWFAVDGGTRTDYTAPFALGEGRRSVAFAAADRLGNTEPTKTAVAFIDASAPGFAFAADRATVPAPGGFACVANDLTLAFEVSDPSVDGASAGLAAVAAVLDGAPLAVDFAPGDAVASGSVGLGAGLHVLTFSAEDRVGNRASRTLRVTVGDAAAPTLALRFPDPSQSGLCRLAQGPVTVRGAVADQNLAGWSLSQGAVLLGSGTADAQGVLGVWNAAGLSGAYTLELSAQDVAGNAAATSLAVHAGSPARTLALGGKQVLNKPRGVAAGPNRIYVADTNADLVRVFDAAGAALAVLGDKKGAAKLNKPAGLALVASGDILVADANNKRVVKLSPAGILLAEYGKGVLQRPTAVAVSRGRVVVADAKAGRLVVFADSGELLARVDLPPAVGADEDPEEPRPVALAADAAGNIWAADAKGGRVLRYAPGLTLAQTIPGFSRPEGVAVSASGACLAVADSKAARIRTFDAEASAGLAAFGVHGEIKENRALPAEFLLNKPAQLAFDAQGALLVADRNNDLIQGFGLPGTPVVVAMGTPGRSGTRLAAADGEAEGTVASARVGRLEGGRVAHPDGAAVEVPAGALGADSDVAVAKAANSGDDHRAREAARGLAGLAAASAAREFSPHGLAFSQPALVTLPYDPALVAAPPELKVHYWNAERGAWEALASVVDEGARTVSARVAHFSVYQVLAPAHAITTLADPESGFAFRAVYVFPNPAVGGQRPTVHVAVGRADKVTVRFYDIAGTPVHEAVLDTPTTVNDESGPHLAYEHAWEGHIPSGVYLYSVTAEKAGQAPIRRVGKLAVVR